MFAYSFPAVGKAYVNLLEEQKYFITAIAISGIGLIIHFAKKRKDVTPEMRTTGELLEILMFMIIPAFALMGILQSEIKENLFLVPIIFLPTMGIWFVISSQLIHKEYYDEGKKVKSFVESFFFSMLAYGVAITVLIWLFFS